MCVCVCVCVCAHAHTSQILRESARAEHPWDSPRKFFGLRSLIGVTSPCWSWCSVR